MMDLSDVVCKGLWAAENEHRMEKRFLCEA